MTRLRVLLIDEGFPGSAECAVRLRDAGCDISVLCATDGVGVCDRPSLRWRLGPAPDTGGFLDSVARAIRIDEPDVVMPATDPVQGALWNNAGPWTELLFPAPSEHQRTLLADKHLLLDEMRRIGIATPDQEAVTAAGDIDALPAGRFPVVVKGSRGRGGTTTFVARTRAVARGAARVILDSGLRCAVQPFIDGPTYLAGGVFNRGEALRLYTGVKVEQHPPIIGPASVIRSVDAPLLAEAMREAMRHLAWTGLASADFIRDESGDFLLLEINPRPWGSIAAARDAGIDLFAPLVGLMRGENPVSDLSMIPDIETRVFPLVLLSGKPWKPTKALREAHAGLRGEQGHLWRDPLQAAHLVHRLWRMWRRWPR